MSDLPDLKAGDRLTAGWLNGLKRLVTGKPFEVAAPLAWMKTGARWILVVAFGQELDMKITASGGGGSYTLLEQYATGGGGWSDGTISVIGYEYNLNPGLTVGDRKSGV